MNGSISSRTLSGKIKRDDWESEYESEKIMYKDLVEKLKMMRKIGSQVFNEQEYDGSLHESSESIISIYARRREW